MAFVCTSCGSEWSAMMGDNEVPELCPYCRGSVIWESDEDD